MFFRVFMKGMTLLRPLPVFLALLLLVGCVHMPEPDYKKVDKTSPAFQEALTAETQRLVAEGKSTREAGNIAERRIERCFATAEASRRTGQAEPLLLAMKDLERPTGCWACTITTTRREAGTTTVTVERFNPSESEARLWTLLSRDGQSPDDTAQQSYRRAKLKSWKKQLKKSSKRKSPHDRIKRNVLAGEFSMASSEATGLTTFTMNLPGLDVTGIGHFPRTLETHTVDPRTNTLTRHTSTFLEPLRVRILGRKFEIALGESTADYALIDPALPPFVVRKTDRQQGKFGSKDHDAETEMLFSDYKRVTCYDDRFTVSFGPLQSIEFLPEGK